MQNNPISWTIQLYFFLTYCIESIIELTICKCLIQFFPSSRWGLKHCYFQCETLRKEIKQPEISYIHRALSLVATYLPWHSKCLDQALAAQRMLTRRGLESTLYLGMMKISAQQWTAHAWIRCHNHWVIGYHSNQHYIVVGTYA